MTSIYKIAQEYEDSFENKDSAGHEMCKYTAILHALAMIHQHGHWKSKADHFYGDHLLFERLYDGTTDHIDKSAEKTIGVFGDKHIQLNLHIEIIESFIHDLLGVIPEDSEDKDTFVKRSLLSEEGFLKYSEEMYNSLKDSDNLTLGLDDMIMSIHSDHEGFVYLLKQRLGEANAESLLAETKPMDSDYEMPELEETTETDDLETVLD